jgi:hypothetical protein
MFRRITNWLVPEASTRVEMSKKKSHSWITLWRGVTFQKSETGTVDLVKPTNLHTSASYVISNLVSVYTNLYWNKNETKMYIVHSKATCCNSSWIKWHQAGSIYSTSKMMHGPINIRFCHSIYECLAQSVEAKANVILCNSYTIFLFQILTISQFSITFPIPLDCTTIHAVKIGLLNKKLKSVNLDRYWDVGCRMRAVLAS